MSSTPSNRPEFLRFVPPLSLSTTLSPSSEHAQLSGSGVFQEKTWKNRRSQRMDKMELLTLQSSLKSEIEAKETMRDELRTVKARNVELEKYVRAHLSCYVITPTKMHDVTCFVLGNLRRGRCC